MAPNPPCKLKLLFDFELLNHTELDDREKATIKKAALNYVTPANLESFYGETYNLWHSCDGLAVYYKHRVYKNGRYLYDIMQLAKVKSNFMERVYPTDQCTVTRKEYSTTYAGVL